MTTVLVALHVVVCIFLVAVVLLVVIGLYVIIAPGFLGWDYFREQGIDGSILRILVGFLFLFFAGLVSLEIWHGFFRLGTLTRKQRDEALEVIREGQAGQARHFSDN